MLSMVVEALLPFMGALTKTDLPVNLFSLQKAFGQAATVWAMCGKHSSSDTSSTTVTSRLSCPILLSETTAGGQLSIT